MSLTRNGRIRCDWCGKLTSDRDGSYRRPNGTWGRIVQPEWERFPGGDPTAPGLQTSNDICEECAACRCPGCGGESVVHVTPPAGPFGWGGRCRDCGHTWTMPVSPEED